MKRVSTQRGSAGAGRGSRFTADDVHAFIVIMVIACIIIGLGLKITFF
jgi:uncharacterized protein (DUF983 family)